MRGVVLCGVRPLCRTWVWSRECPLFSRQGRALVWDHGHVGKSCPSSGACLSSLVGYAVVEARFFSWGKDRASSI